MSAPYLSANDLAALADIDAILAAARPCDGETFCHDECECQVAAGIAVAANPATVTRVVLPCCGDSGDCDGCE